MSGLVEPDGPSNAFRSGSQGSARQTQAISPVTSCGQSENQGRGQRLDESSDRMVRSDFKSKGEGVRPVPEAIVKVDWRLLLNDLQREKKRAKARDEEQYTNRSCFFLDSESVVRECLIKIVEWPLFDRLILVCIVINCIFLILDEPVCRCAVKQCTEAELYSRLLYPGKSCDGWENTEEFLNWSEIVFTILFTVEMVIKIAARGFILHKHSYLRDTWNWLDFVVVVTSLVQLDASVSAQFSFLRTVRVLRPLRTLTRIKGMRPLINTFLRSFQALGSVVALLSFLLLVYGILGIELLSSTLRGRCYFDPNANVFPPAVQSRLQSQQIPYIVESQNSPFSDGAPVNICSLDSVQGTQCEPQAIDGTFYETVCSRKKWCRTDWCSKDWNDNPISLGGGHINYDNIGQAVLTLFQVLTIEQWVDIWYAHGHGWSRWGSRVFHTSWVLIATFFVVQLALAVISTSFVQAQEEEKTEKEREALSEEAILQVPPSVQKNHAFEKEEADTRDGKGRFSSMFSIARSGMLSRGSSREQTTLLKRIRMKCSDAFSNNPIVLGLRKYFKIICHRVTIVCRVIISASYFQQVIIFAILLNTATLCVDFHDQRLFEDSICKRRCDLDSTLPASASQECVGPIFNHTWSSDGFGAGEKKPQTGLSYCFINRHDSVMESHLCADQLDAASCYASSPNCFWFGDRGQKCMRGLYSSDSFAQEREQTFSLRHFCGDGASLCPTFPVSLKGSLDMTNTVLTFFFIVEMVLKMLGLGLRGYFKDSYNKFDFFVVMSSIVEMVVLASQGATDQKSSLSAMRGMRLFRLFKLARSWKGMQTILTTLAVALSSLGPLTIVWVMMMYIFSLLGMQIFGRTFRTVKTDEPRSNYDSFLPSVTGLGAFVTTLRIISTEDWNLVMFDCIRAFQNPFAALYSIAVTIFGTNIIMNLFISILLSGFDDDDEDDDDDKDLSGHGQGPASQLAAKFRKLVVSMLLPSLPVR